MFTLVCPDCRSEVSLSARRLLVRLDAGRSVTGEVLFTCLACHRSPSVALDAPTVAALVTSDVTFLSLSEQVVEHPESLPGGPALTHDDLLDLHAELDRDAWFDALADLER
jgi:hypothetical protein